MNGVVIRDGHHIELDEFADPHVIEVNDAT
jgi:hypothetical protein